MMSAALVSKSGSFDAMYRSNRCDRSSASCQMRSTMSLVTPTWAARRRQDQCVDPSGGRRRVAASTRARSRTVNFHRGRPRWRLVKPSTPCSKNQRRHLAMVGRETSSFVSTARAETPTARSSTIPGRCTNPAGKGVRAGDLLEVIALCVGQMNRRSFKRHTRRRRQSNGNTHIRRSTTCQPVHWHPRRPYEIQSTR